MFLLVFVVLLLTPLNSTDGACVLRTFVGTNQACKWLACAPQSDSGVCEFSSSTLLDALNHSIGLNLTELEDDLQRCFDASRVLLSMLVNSSSRALAEGQHTPRHALAPLFLGTHAFVTHPTGDMDVHDVGDFAGSHAERAVLQAPVNSQNAAESNPLLPQALAQVSQCPTAVPQGVSDVAKAEELVQFVARRCRNVAGVPAAYVFGDIVGTGQVTDATVCLPSEIQRDAFVAAEACLAQNTQDLCLEQILEMWNVDTGTAKAVASVGRDANSTCVYGASPPHDSASTSGDTTPHPTNRTTCLVDRSAAAETVVNGLAGSVNSTSGCGAVAHRWVTGRAMLVGLLLGVLAGVG